MSHHPAPANELAAVLHRLHVTAKEDRKPFGDLFKQSKSARQLVANHAAAVRAKVLTPSPQVAELLAVADKFVASGGRHGAAKHVLGKLAGEALARFGGFAPVASTAANTRPAPIAANPPANPVSAPPAPKPAAPAPAPATGPAILYGRDRTVAAFAQQSADAQHHKMRADVAALRGVIASAVADCAENPSASDRSLERIRTARRSVSNSTDGMTSADANLVSQLDRTLADAERDKVPFAAARSMRRVASFFALNP